MIDGQNLVEMMRIINLSEEDYKILKKNADVTPDSYQEYTDGKGRRALKSYLEYLTIHLIILIRFHPLFSKQVLLCIKISISHYLHFL